MTGRTVIVAAVVLGVGLAVWLFARRGEFDLPRRIRVEEPVADLTAGAGREAVQAEMASDPVRIGGLTPGQEVEAQGRYRRAIVVPPPSRLAFRTRIPANARLRFGIAVGGAGKRDREAAGVRFTVEVDGRQAFTRVVNPARSRHDRRWLDADLALGGAEREVEITLRTERDGDGARLSGTAGWSQVRIVRETWHDRQAASPAAPSVLVLMVDTLRADHLGCYGAAPDSTPNVDRLAGAALVFEDMVSSSSWTMPSVATFLTGLHPRSHGVQGRSDDAPSDTAFLSDALPTLPELAQRAGITTVGVSANPLVSRATNFTRGFETFVEGGWERARNNWMSAEQVNTTFLRWLGKNRGHRFLAYLHYMEPHDPYTPAAARPAPPAGASPEIVEGQVDRVTRRMRVGKHAPLPADAVGYLRRLYGLEVRDWDGALGELLAALDAAGVRDSTTIVLLGDHGEEFQEHGQLKHRIHLYDELLHVPLLIARPGATAGRVREQVQGVDVFPTLAALLDVPLPPGLPGQSLLAPFEARPAISETRYGILPDGRGAEIVSIRAGGWKLITAPKLSHFELYDLARDPGETDDRFGRAPEGATLAATLAAWQAAAPTPPPVAGRDPMLQKKLRALGYVE